MRSRIVMAVGILVLAAGCASRPPQGVTDLNRMWDRTRDGCASVYLQNRVRTLEPDVQAMNALVADEKYRKAGEQAETLLPRVESLGTEAERAKAAAKKEADAAIAEASDALAAAGKAEAETYAASEYRKARSTLDRAKNELKDPCGYLRARDLAREAAGLARQSGKTAIAEKQRLEEERRRAEEEARRLEEERRRRAKPATYTVVRGDSLWRISSMDRIYGDPLLWPVLYEENRNMIRNPELIYPNQEFRIPRNVPMEEMKKRAMRFLRTYVPQSPME